MKTVLLVDDDDVIIEVVRQVLRKIGYHALTADNGKTAVEIYRESRVDIDIVILDLAMPIMSGIETFDRLKEINSDVKIILASGYDIENQPPEIIARGFDGFLRKPFNIDALSQTLRDILDQG